MQCPVCNQMFMTGTVCPNCDLDNQMYFDADKLSNRLFNRGLERLNFSDLFHGIDYLQKSISVSKNNISARNLLGLALNEIGHVGEALYHWTMSLNLHPEDNPASEYIERVSGDKDYLERSNGAIILYNRALNHIKQKSDDLAIIELKKALELNPQFIDAYNLATLCYLIQNDSTNATAALERALSIDPYNPVSLNYYKLLHPQWNRPTGKSQSNQLNKSGKLVSQSGIPISSLTVEPPKKGFRISFIVAFVVGALIAYGLGFFLFLPRIEASHYDEMERVIYFSNNQVRVINELHDSLTVDHNSLIAEYNALVSEFNSLVDDENWLRQIWDIHQAFWLFENGEFERAVDMLDTIGSPESFNFPPLSSSE